MLSLPYAYVASTRIVVYDICFELKRHTHVHFYDTNSSIYEFRSCGTKRFVLRGMFWHIENDLEYREIEIGFLSIEETYTFIFVYTTRRCRCCHRLREGYMSILSRPLSNYTVLYPQVVI